MEAVLYMVPVEVTKKKITESNYYLQDKPNDFSCLSFEFITSHLHELITFYMLTESIYNKEPANTIKQNVLYAIACSYDWVS